MKTTTLIAAFSLSFVDNLIVAVIVIGLFIFFFWFMRAPSPEDDGSSEFDEDDYDDDEFDRDIINSVAHQTVFDKIVPGFTCDNSPLIDITRCDGDASITFKANATLREVIHFIQAVLDNAGYDSRYLIDGMSEITTIKIINPVSFKLDLIKSETEKGVFVLTFEYE